MGLVYGLVPAGRPRRRALVIGVALCAVLAVGSILTRTYTPSEIGIGFIIGFSIPFLGFRVFAPEAVFPVTYRSGRTAHLDIDGDRGAAIDIALREQLGLEVAHKEPFGLAGSGGSTPLKIELTDGRRLFEAVRAEPSPRRPLVQARSYGDVRSARGRTLVQLRPPDGGVRGLHARYLRDCHAPTAEAYGFAEITPEREYLLVTGFIDDAKEMLDAPVDDTVIASGIALIRSLWDAGLATATSNPRTCSSGRARST